MPTFKSILTPQGSVVSGIAVAGSVWALYAMAEGSMASVHMTEANSMACENARKKAAYTSFIFVSAVTLMTKDANVGILGYGAIVVIEIAYRHGIMVDPATGIMQAPAETAAAYADAQNVVPIDQQGYAVG
jgi:hypothetical protein